VVNFCPHCGHHLARIECGKCGSEMEAGWKFCVLCGTGIGGS